MASPLIGKPLAGAYLGLIVIAAAAAFTAPRVATASGLRHVGFGPQYAPTRAGPSALSLTVSVGFQNVFRGTAWTPVHVQLANRGSSDLSGSLEIPMGGESSGVGGQPSFHGLYQAPAVVPAGSAKTVTLYVPGSGVQGQLNVAFRVGSAVIARATTSPVGIDASALLVGVLARSPSDLGWIAPAIQGQVTTHVLSLTPRAIEPVPEALATFDLVALADTDTSLLDRAQMDALDRYVRDGGSLLVVGGPTWQETLRPLPPDLLPGRLSGQRILRGLNGLLPLVHSSHAMSRAPLVVSVLRHARGITMASQSGVPLVVRATVGRGTVTYLAFDPSLAPIPGWSGAPDLEQHLVAASAALAIARTWSPGGFRARFQTIFKTRALTGELSNLPATTVPLLALFAALSLAYVLILGPANFLVLRALGQPHLAWITVPVLAVAYVASINVVVDRARAGTSVLNTLGIVTVQGSVPARPATFYGSLATPRAGDYHVAYSSPSALPAPLPSLNLPAGFSFRSASTIRPSPLGMRLQEDPQAGATLLNMRPWTNRDLSLQTTVDVPGTVASGLTLDGRGYLAGSIRNNTNLDLLDPVLVAGQTVVRLPALPAGGSVHARLQPAFDDSNQLGATFWSQLYGGPSLDATDDFGRIFDCCAQSSLPSERHLIDRVRNAMAMVSQAQPDAFSSLGDVLLLGWSRRTLIPAQVDGTTPQQRSLTLVITPLKVHFPSHGQFQIPTGAIGARLIDLLPRAPQSACCGFGPGGRSDQTTSVGPGGSLTFEFDLPVTHRVRWRSLSVAVSTEDDGAEAGQMYNWSSGRWTNVDLSNGTAQLRHPSPFVSPLGQVLFKLLATNTGGNLDVYDPYHDLQISGSGTVL